MNKPAPKEPSMDEILSSIRQIIADDETSSDAQTTQAEPQPAGSAADDADDAMPLSTEQIVDEEEDEDSDFMEAVNTDISAEGDDEDTMSEAEKLLMSTSEPGMDADEAAQASAESSDLDTPDLVVPDDIAFDMEDETPEPVEEAPAVSASSMPDPDLSADIAEKLLEPATGAAVHQTFSKLNKMNIGIEGLTIESMVREMLRPMLKEWLDENLPTLVERMVEKEIERVSRGG